MINAVDIIEKTRDKKELTDEEIIKNLKANKELRFKSDIYGSPEYKRYLLAVTINDLYRKVRGGQR